MKLLLLVATKIVLIKKKIIVENSSKYTMTYTLKIKACYSVKENYVKSSWPFWIGLHTCHNENYNEMQWCEPELIFKNFLSTDYILKLECMKQESLVIADNNIAVNITEA